MLVVGCDRVGLVWVKKLQICNNLIDYYSFGDVQREKLLCKSRRHLTPSGFQYNRCTMSCRSNSRWITLTAQLYKTFSPFTNRRRTAGLSKLYFRNVKSFPFAGIWQVFSLLFSLIFSHAFSLVFSLMFSMVLSRGFSLVFSPVFSIAKLNKVQKGVSDSSIPSLYLTPTQLPPSAENMC